MTQPPRLDGYAMRIVDDHSLEVEIRQGQSLNALFATLSGAGLEAASVRNKTNRLEELFLNLIGNGSGEGA